MASLKTLKTSVVSLQLYSSLDNEPTRLIEFACIFTAGKRALLGNYSSTITVPCGYSKSTITAVIGTLVYGTDTL